MIANRARAEQASKNDVGHKGIKRESAFDEPHSEGHQKNKLKFIGIKERTARPYEA